MSGAARRRLAVLHPYEFAGDNAGLHWLHVASLVELLEPLGWTVESRSLADPRFADSALGADVAVIQMLTAPEAEGVILRRRDLGRPTVYEITDNVLGVGDWLPRSAAVRSPLVRQAILYHAHLADALQMLVPALAELFAEVNPHRMVLQPHTPFPAELPPKPPGFVFGWSGGRSHAESLRAAAPAVVELSRRHPDATFAFMGDRGLFEELFGAIPAAQRRVRPFGTRDEQARFVGGLHVGIAPMEPTPFNATRADTRVGIFSGHGVAAVLQDAPPHRPHAARARIYATSDELLAILDELFHDRAQVEALARAGREWMLRERSDLALGLERDRAYRALLDAARGPAQVADSAVASSRRVPEPDAAALSASLVNTTRADPERVLEVCRDLVAQHPGYDQARLALARTLEQLGRHDEALAYVEAARPSPIYADLFAELKARVAPDERARLVASIRSPFRRARLEHFDSPGDRGRAVLEHNPYDHFALASTIRHLERDRRDPEELDALYRQASMVAPEHVPAARRPPRLAAFLPA